MEEFPKATEIDLAFACFRMADVEFFDRSGVVEPEEGVDDGGFPGGVGTENEGDRFQWNVLKLGAKGFEVGDLE